MEVTKAVTNTMRHEEYNRRYAALVEITEAISNQDREEPEEGSDEARKLAQEAYDLMLEVPPASTRYKYLNAVFKYHGGYGVVKVNPADNSKEAKKIALRDPKMPVTHHASRGRTFKATPRQLADGKVAALEAQVSAFLANVAEHEAKVVQAKAELAQAQAKLEAARKAAKGMRGGAKKAPSAAPASQAKATAKAPAAKALSPGMVAELKAVAKKPKKLSNTPQARVMRMHLVMRGLLVKGTMAITEAGKAALKGL